MQKITQPVTVTDMRRDPKALLKRVKKEGVVPILVHSDFPAAVIAVDKLNELYESIKQLKHELFVIETVTALEDYKKNGGSGPFNSIDAFEKHIHKISKEKAND